MAQYDPIVQQYENERRNKNSFNYNNVIEIPNMLNFVGNLKNKKVLDLGCGFGDHVELYVKKGAKEIIGLDISKEMISIAKKRKIKRVYFKVYDLNKKLPFQNNFFDIVTSSLTINYIKNFNQLFKEVHRILKDKGLFIFSVGHPIFNCLVERKVRNGCEYIIGVKKINEFKREIYGNYFDEFLQEKNLGKGKIVKVYLRTNQTIIKTFLRNGFELVDYLDAKPIPSSKKINPSKYELTSKLPTFSFFKLKKI